MVRNVPMFSVPPAPPVTLSKMLSALAKERGAYSRYQAKGRVACDECIAVLHEAGGRGPVAMGARFTRRGGDRSLRLCRPHADLWRALDGVGK